MLSKDTFARTYFALTLQLAAGILILTGTSAYAAEGGYTNYIPGFYGDFGVAVKPDPGFYLIQNFYYHTAEESKVIQYGELRAGVEVDVAMYMLTGMQVFDYEIFGGRYAAGLGVPIVASDFTGRITIGPETGKYSEDRTAIGDLMLIPVSLFWDSENFHFNFHEAIVAPTGSYDKDRNVDAGLNYWSFDTTLAATYLNMETGLEVSAAVGYIYNTENDDTNYQTGQEIHLDHMLNQFLSETFAVGLHGYYYKQITGDSGSGAIFGDFKGEAAGIGPAIMWMPKITDRDIMISAKWLHDYHTENRLDGDHFWLSATMKF